MSDKSLEEKMIETFVREEERQKAIDIVDAQIALFTEQLHRTVGAIAALRQVRAKLENEETPEKEEEKDGKAH
jgi:hypothetical protein